MEIEKIVEIIRLNQYNKGIFCNSEEDRYHVVRFIQSDCRLNIFGEMFMAPPQTQYEYVVATVDVKEQKPRLYLDSIQVEDYRYQM